MKAKKTLLGNYFKDLKNLIRDLDPEISKQLKICASVIFLVLFTYPMMRSLAEGLFLQVMSAKKSPHVWLYSILTLSVVIAFYNKFQQKLKAKGLYIWTSFGTVITLGVGYFLLVGGNKLMAYPFYILKEVYVVLLLHMAYAYINNLITYDQAKTLFGPLAALGGLGGVLGGLLTSFLSSSVGMNSVFITATIGIALSGVLFFGITREIVVSKVGQEKSPMEAIQGAGKYIFLVASLIALSQFVIGIASFQFNVSFAELVPDKDLKIKYLGLVYTSINGFSLIMQILIVPILLRAFSLRTLHFTVIALFGVLILIPLYGGVGALYMSGLSYIGLKGSDYSLFNIGKEMLYLPLNKLQKYGAKYLSDMVCYRGAKGVISFVLIYFQNMTTLLILGGVFLGIWALILIPVFKEREVILMRSK